MPIFEYKCKQCDNKFEVLHKSSTNQEEVSCPKCNSKKIKNYYLVLVHQDFHQSSSSCESGNCGVTPSYGGGCSSGMCGLN